MKTYRKKYLKNKNTKKNKTSKIRKYKKLRGGKYSSQHTYIAPATTQTLMGGNREKNKINKTKSKKNKNRKTNKFLVGWVAFVKKIQKKYKVSYKEAMIIAKKQKDKGVKWMGGKDNGNLSDEDGYDEDEGYYKDYKDYEGQRGVEERGYQRDGDEDYEDEYDEEPDEE